MSGANGNKGCGERQFSAMPGIKGAVAPSTESAQRTSHKKQIKQLINLVVSLREGNRGGKEKIVAINQKFDTARARWVTEYVIQTSLFTEE